MPIEIAPNRIELDRLDGGYAPDTPESGLSVNASPDVLNLLMEPGGAGPEVRKGFERLSAGRSTLAAHYCKNLFYYEVIDSGTRKRYLMAVMSDGTANANNVQVWAYDLINDTFTRVDTAGRVWNNSKAPHWAVVTSGFFYGGVRGDAIYRWNPTSGWSADPTALSSPKTWVDAINDGVNTATEIARDYAYRRRQKVTYAGDNYSSLRDVRYDTWESGENYKLGDLVSRKTVWAATSSYWKSFECIRTHTASSTNAPGTGANQSSYWKKVRLPNILDADSDISDAWTFAGNGVKGSVGEFYGDRMFVRRDNEDDRSKLQYSAPLALEKNVDIPDAIWNPTDWAPVDDINGEGGGWLPFSGGQGDAIRDVHEMGNYLIVSKRWGTWVLAGRSEASWSVRKLGDHGAVSNQCIADVDGLAYGLSHSGTLWVTDGTGMREVPGYEKAREFIKERIDRLLQNGVADDEHWMPMLWGYDHKVWIALPDAEGAGTPDDITMVYDPVANQGQGAWWKLDLPVLSATTGAKNRAQRMWFTTPYRGSGRATVFEYGDDPGDIIYVDDDPEAVGAGVSTNAIPWHYRTSWLQFGTTHNNRRIRRVWALVKTAVDVTIDAYRDFVMASADSTVTRSAGSGSTSFIEGKSMGRPASAVSLKVSGTAATGGPAIIGIGVDTQPIRTRYHRN